MFFFTTKASRAGRFSTPSRRRSASYSGLEQLEQRDLLAAVILVDDDGVQFESAQFDSIQAAVDAADPGDIIRVAPGIYQESVRVAKELTIQGAFASAAQSEDRRFASIVDPPGAASASPGFDLVANDIAIQGFSIGDYDGDASAAGSAGGSIGVRTSAEFSGYHITNSVIQENSIGVDFASSGELLSKIKTNTIRNNNDGFGDLLRAGNGVISTLGASNTTIRGNIITDQLASAMALTGPAGTQGGLAIESNAIGDAVRDDSGAAIVLANVVDATVTDNVSVNSRTNGIEIRGASDSLLIDGNVIRDAALVAIEQAAVRIPKTVDIPDFTLNARPTTELTITISGNEISGAGRTGIHLNSTGGTHVLGNVVTRTLGAGTGGGSGIDIDNSTHNRIESNVLSSNTGAGIAVDANSTLNKMKTNNASSNARFDFEDLSSGGYTADTANVWTRNRGGTQNRPGLIG